jgi:hypothetical protein
MTTKSICPFKAGDNVIYKPSPRGLGLDANNPWAMALVPGRTYAVREIEEERYVVVEGYDDPHGGIHWTEFEAAK